MVLKDLDRVARISWSCSCVGLQLWQGSHVTWLDRIWQHHHQIQSGYFEEQLPEKHEEIKSRAWEETIRCSTFCSESTLSHVFDSTRKRLPHQPVVKGDVVQKPVGGLLTYDGFCIFCCWTLSPVCFLWVRDIPCLAIQPIIGALSNTDTVNSVFVRPKVDPWSFRKSNPSPFGNIRKTRSPYRLSYGGIPGGTYR